MDSEAYEWLKKAAEQGHLLAQGGVGLCYSAGRGVSRDEKEALKWYTKAAEQGHDYMQACVGTYYRNGRGVPRDDQKAVEWFRKAAEQGNALAQSNLGACYADGEGVPRDEKEAVKWFRLAAEQGFADAQLNLGVCYQNSRGVLVDDKEAVKWFRLAAEQGKPAAQYRLGLCYAWGKGVPFDKKEEMKWYRLAAEQEYVDAQFNLGMCYFTKDSKEAAKWLLCAATQGHRAAQFLMGLLYTEGQGVTQDHKEAAKWFLCAAKQGHPLAQSSFGLCCAEGQGVTQDHKEAVKWYLLAAEQEQADAQCNLGHCYDNGDGVLEDYVEAYAWYAISAMNGSEQGAKNKEICKKQFHSAQITAGQARAKELQSMIERTKQVAELGDDEMPSADISPSGFGSGLLINGGYVLTCWHVVDGGDKVSVSCQGKDYAATVVQKDPANDIAVLRVTDAPLGAPLRFSDVKLGENVFTLGFPHPDLQGFDVKFTTGSISALTGPGSTPVYYQISAPLQSGNSGGPLFDEQGNLVGMVAAKLDSLMTLAATGDLPQNVNYAIKADYLKPILKTVNGITIQPAQTKPVNLLSLVEELKKSVVMIKVY